MSKRGDAASIGFLRCRSGALAPYLASVEAHAQRGLDLAPSTEVCRCGNAHKILRRLRQWRVGPLPLFEYRKIRASITEVTLRHNLVATLGTVALTAILAGLSSAEAADMLTKTPPLTAPIAFSWTGYYGGLNAGWVQ
jgi:hypothetical protein